MSFTVRERRNPPSRRKSCTACIRSKRRCDGAIPACVRCGNRGLSCEYPLRKARRVGALSTAAVDRQADADAGDDAIQGLDFASFHFHFDEQIPHEDVFGLKDLDDAIVGCADICGDPFHAPLGLSHQPGLLAIVPSPPADTLSATASVDMATRRLQFALDETRRAPLTMARDMQTPWSHPALYRDEMPRAMRDALAACAMYASVDRLNAPVVLRAIGSFADDLLASDAPPTLRGRLAHTQALILYQVIRLLDGDIGARVAAERQCDALEASAFALLPHIDYDGLVPPGSGIAEPIPLHPAAGAVAAWRSWVTHESARRTFLFALYFLQAYRILAGLQLPRCDGRLSLCRALTVSARLWDAAGAVAFARLWNDGRYFVVQEWRFEALLRDAEADDVDTFAKMLLSSAMGIDEAEGWFAARGGSLRDT